MIDGGHAGSAGVQKVVCKLGALICLSLAFFSARVGQGRDHVACDSSFFMRATCACILELLVASAAAAAAQWGHARGIRSTFDPVP